MSEFRSSEDLNGWLADKPYEFAVVLTMRTCLRIIPLLPPSIYALGRRGERTTLPLASEFHSLAELWFSIAATAYEVPVTGIDRRSARAIAYNAHRALNARQTIRGFAKTAAALLNRSRHRADLRTAAHGALAIDHAMSVANPARKENRAGLAAAETAAAARSAIQSATVKLMDKYYIQREVDLAEHKIWKAISTDAAALEIANPIKFLPHDLSIQPLWPNGIPEWLGKQWENVKRALLAAEEGWDVWTDWYDERLRGGPINEQFEYARLLIPAEIWKEGTKAVNSYIKKLPRPPKPPEEGAGPHLVPTPVGFEILPTSPSEAERENPTQVALHAQIKRRIERAKPLVTRMRNTHYALHEEFGDYEKFASVDLQNLDIASLWSTGAALADMIDSVARIPAANPAGTGFMTEQLEPETLAQLQSLVRDHTALILGFTLGQELAARAATLRLLNIEPSDLARRSRDVLAPMVQEPSLLASNANSLVQALNRALDVTDEKTFVLVSAAVATATHSIIAFGRAISPILASVALCAGVTGANLSNLTGDPNAETIRAALRFLLGNANAISAFAAYDNRLQAWLDWLISEIRLNIPDDKNL